MFLVELEHRGALQARQFGKNWEINKNEISETKNGGERSHLSPPLASLPLHKKPPRPLQGLLPRRRAGFKQWAALKANQRVCGWERAAEEQKMLISITGAVLRHRQVKPARACARMAVCWPSNTCQNGAPPEPWLIAQPFFTAFQLETCRETRQERLERWHRKINLQFSLCGGVIGI